MKNKKSRIYSSFDDFCSNFNLKNIKNLNEFEEAMTHSSVSKKKNYERMEFLGDAILNFCVSRMIFEKNKNDTEGSLSKKKSFLCSRQVCKIVAKDIKLDSQVIKSKNVNIETIIADIVESLLCLIYYNFGIDKTYEIVKSLFSEYLNSPKILDQKTRLQEITQKQFKQLPVYSLISKEGSEHEPVFKISISCGDLYTEGVGNSKKKAEKQAAEKMLSLLDKKNNKN